MKDQTVESLMQKLDEATALINKLRRSAKHYQRECYTWRQQAQRADIELTELRARLDDPAIKPFEAIGIAATTAIAQGLV